MYTVKFTKKFEKQFKKLDKPVQINIKKWMEKHIINNENPKNFGKALVGNFKGYWRYRIGDYRLIVEINDEECVIIAIDIEHRREVYDMKKK